MIMFLIVIVAILKFVVIFGWIIFNISFLLGVKDEDGRNRK